MIDGLCKNGLLDEAVKMLNEMSRDGVDPDIVTYSALINGFCKVGRFRTVKEIVCRVYRAGLSPNGIIYSTLIYNYCMMGCLKEALRIYEAMILEGILQTISRSTYSSLLYVKLVKLGGRVYALHDQWWHSS
ncbi:hypothetical protein Bca52824_035947 [Brassica carinata]|uniref:Pentatricopeptide repeat-containing protein n=1 Tax=Brassica carinata TaxID=52824 RepID=A0A8X7V156_BRACI|nr:hypothetical protein Bca52824_035947 [Brassica carinata]